MDAFIVLSIQGSGYGGSLSEVQGCAEMVSIRSVQEAQGAEEALQPSPGGDVQMLLAA